MKDILLRIYAAMSVIANLITRSSGVSSYNSIMIGPIHGVPLLELPANPMRIGVYIFASFPGNFADARISINGTVVNLTKALDNGPLVIDYITYGELIYLPMIIDGVTFNQTVIERIRLR